MIRDTKSSLLREQLLHFIYNGFFINKFLGGIGESRHSIIS